MPANRARRVLVALDRVLVVEVDEGSAGERSGDLREDVVRHLRPRKPATYGQRDRDGRIDVRAADAACDVDGEHHRDHPSEGDEQPVARCQEDRVIGGGTAGLVQGRDGHRDHAVAEGNQHECAEVLREKLSPDRLPPSRACAHTNVPDPHHPSGFCRGFGHVHLPISNSLLSLERGRIAVLLRGQTRVRRLRRLSSGTVQSGD